VVSTRSAIRRREEEVLEQLEETCSVYIAAVCRNLCENEMFVNETVRSWLSVQRKHNDPSLYDSEPMVYLESLFRSILVEPLDLRFMAKSVRETVVSVRVFKSFAFRGRPKHMDMYSNLLGEEDREQLALLARLYKAPVMGSGPSNARHWSQFPYNHLFEQYWSRAIFAKKLALSMLAMGLEGRNLRGAAEMIHYVVSNICNDPRLHATQRSLCNIILGEAKRVMSGDYEHILEDIAEEMVESFVEYTRENLPTLFTDE